MLDDHQLEEYFQEHGLLAQARQYIRQTRNDPSRLVGVGAQSNVISSFPSTKAGALIQTESRTAEHRQALEHEYSKSVIEFWDQPPAIGVVRTSAKGKPLSGHHIPDFVVLDTTGPYVEEVKTAEEIERLLQTKPADWVRVDSGVTFAPALAAFSRIGLSYVVTSAANTNAIRADNLKLLLQSRKAPPYVNDGLRAAEKDPADRLDTAAANDRRGLSARCTVRGVVGPAGFHVGRPIARDSRVSHRV